MQWKTNDIAVIQSISAGHNPWIMFLCEPASYFYFSQENFGKKMLFEVFLPFIFVVV